ncbi:bifunctional metallophosphatase/5'-nucleotidase [Myxococcus vastator]|uniref:bifunctional metallophosphatase/5'-nucleotidase n=1 Tax=Myxococcus vastator TaxID=2709664 RepID=UPI0013CF5B12|nr:5'-nucleotidase C-terminal domain-containing protein [Myxococcus vastator]
MRSFRLIALAWVCGATLACAGARTRAAPPEPIRLTLVGINDFHGQVEPHRTPLKDGQVVEEGGAATLAAYVARLRADNPGGVVLLDAGDMFQGTLPSNLTEGAVVIDVYNHLGVDAAAIGNHEFDYGPVGPGSMARRPGDDPLGALKARIGQARFPLLSANLRDAATGAAPAWTGNDGTYLMEVKGVKVGILGLSTEDTPKVTNPANVTSLRFLPLAPAALEASRSLRARGAEVVVAVAHAGGKCADLSNPRDTSSCDLGDAEILSMLERLPPGTLDAVVAGHTHQTMGHFFAQVPIIETTGLARSLGVVELFVDPASRRVLPERTRIQAAIPLCAKVDATQGTCDGRRLRNEPQVRLEPASFMSEPVVPDARVAPLLAPALDLARQAQNRQMGLVAATPLARGYKEESALGNLMADVLRASAKADVGLMNPGGVRANLPAGPLTFGQVFGLLPFDNTVAVITLTGPELEQLLSLAYGNAMGSIFAVSGLEVTLERCPGTERLASVALTGGQPLVSDDRTLYRVALPDFLARGGDGLEPLLRTVPPERIEMAPVNGLDLREALIAYGKARGGTLDAPELGRVHYKGVAKCQPAAR